MTELPNPWISVSPGGHIGSPPSGESEPSVTLAFTPGESQSATPLAAPCDVSVTTAGAVAPSSAPVVSNSDSAASFPAQDDAPNSAGADLQIPAPAAFSNSSSCGAGESRGPGRYADQPDTALGCQVGETMCAPSTEAGAGIASGPHDSISETQYTPEPFSVYAQRRSMHIVSPPLPKVEREIALDFQSLFKKIKEKDDVGDFDDPPVYPLPVCLDHPRDLDLDPPPIFQRKPRPAFLRALLQLGAPQ